MDMVLSLCPQDECTQGLQVIIFFWTEFKNLVAKMTILVANMPLKISETVRCVALCSLME